MKTNHSIPAVQSYMSHIEYMTDTLKKQNSVQRDKALNLILTAYLFGVNSGIRGLDNAQARAFITDLGWPQR